MNQQLFNTIQRNFKKFLNGKSNPGVAVKPIQTPNVRNRRIVEMERTCAFGSQDEGIGYKISSIDSNGKVRTNITHNGN